MNNGENDQIIENETYKLEKHSTELTKENTTNSENNTTNSENNTTNSENNTTISENNTTISDYNTTISDYNTTNSENNTTNSENNTNKTMVFFYTYKTNVKERWKNKSLVDILVHEFRTRSREYFTEAIECGVITVNDKKVRPSYKLQLVDFIKHTVHMHEPLVPEIKIIKEEDEYTVVYKPAGVPCHPTGGYLEYSVTKKLFKDRKVACVNRLDMPVSGILIITHKNLRNSMMKINETEKIYVAKVKGEFPAFVDCRKKLYCEEARRRFVDEERGKECQTLFKLLKYENRHSLVECRPITGRTHQIRIHLQSLGFPIINDLIYGEAEKEEEAEFKRNCVTTWEDEEDKEKMDCVLKHCRGENNRSFDLKNKFICLHAWRYKFNNLWYEAEWPFWTNLYQ